MDRPYPAALTSSNFSSLDAEREHPRQHPGEQPWALRAQHTPRSKTLQQPATDAN
jgi:hypothetical protein